MMKLSQFRGKDRRKIIIITGMAVILAVIVILALILAIRPKVAAMLREYQEKKKEQESRVSQEQNNEENIWETEIYADETEEEDSNYKEDEYKEKDGEDEKNESEETGQDIVAIHRYDYIVEDCTWKQAWERCRDRGGYLVNINSQEEFDYIVGEINAAGLGEKNFYIGGRRDNESEYYWINASGEAYGDLLNGNINVWCFSVWMQGEPSFHDEDITENVMALFFFSGESRWVLNDVPEDILTVLPYYSGKIAYICEYDD